MTRLSFFYEVAASKPPNHTVDWRGLPPIKLIFAAGCQIHYVLWRHVFSSFAGSWKDDERGALLCAEASVWFATVQTKRQLLQRAEPRFPR